MNKNKPLNKPEEAVLLDCPFKAVVVQNEVQSVKCSSEECIGWEQVGREGYGRCKLVTK